MKWLVVRALSCVGDFWLSLRTGGEACILFELGNKDCVHFLQSISCFNNLRIATLAKMLPVLKGAGVIVVAEE